MNSFQSRKKAVLWCFLCLALFPLSVYATSNNAFPLPALELSCPEMSAAWQINVSPITMSPQPTGTRIAYRLQLQCSAISASSCVNSEIRLPAQDPTTFSLALPLNLLPVVDDFYFDDTTMEWVIDLADVIPAGSSIEFDIEAFAPTNITADGTSFVVDATVDADNTETDTDSEPGSWSADADLSVVKFLQFGPDTDALLDLPVSYFVYPCSNGYVNGNEPGNLWIENWTVTDTLPDGVMFVSASTGGTYDPVSNSVTWSGLDTLPLNSCEYMGASDFAVEVIFPSTIFGAAAVPPQLVATNEAVVTGYPVGAPQTPDNLLVDSDEISHGFGLPNPIGVHTKFANTQYFRSQDITYEDDQAEYTVDIRTESAGSIPYFFRIVDPLPCLDNDLTVGMALSQYESNDPGVLCTNPAFQPDDFIEITISERYTSMTDNVAFAAANPTLPLRYLATDGSSGVLNLPFASVGPGGSGFSGNTVSYQMNWADIQAQLGAGVGLSEVIFESQDVGLQVIVTPDDNRLALRLNLEGTVAPDTPTYPVQNQDRVRNYAHFFIITDAGETDIGFIQDDVIINERRPALTVQKTIGETSGLMGLTGTSIGAPFNDQDSLVITDLLPMGYTYDRETQQFMNLCGGLWSWTEGTGDANAGCPELNGISVRNYIEVEVIDDYNGTGRQLVRATFLPPPIPDVWETLNSFRFSFYVNQVPTNLAAVNEARVFPTSQESSDMLLCQAGFSSAPRASSSNDTDDQDGDGLTTGDSFCSDTDDVRPPSTVVDVTSFKAVMGDDPIDQDFQPFPAIGPITEFGGQGAFQINMINSGALSLTDLVIYDVLPHVGDVGLSETQVGNQRESDFDVTFAGINPASLPAGALVEYSFSNTPCRDELTTGVTPFPTGCVDDWTTTIPTTDTALVRGLRITFPSGDLQVFDPGETISLDYDVTYPAGVMPGETGWNVFAFAGTRTDDNTSILPTEPPKVGIGIPLIDLSLNKSVSPTIAYVGDSVKYTITIDHAGSVSPDGVYTEPAGTATNVTILDDFLAQGLTIVPNSSTILRSTDNGDGGSTFDESTGEIFIPRIDPNDTYTICYYAYADVETTETNTAEITAHTEEDIDSEPGNGDPNEDDIDDATASWVTPAIDLQKQVETFAGSGVFIEADASDGLAGSYLEGQPVNYRYLITNTGSVTLRNIMLEDDLLGTECNQTISFLSAGSSTTINCTWPFGFPFSEDAIVNVASVSGTSEVDDVEQTVMDVDSATIFTDIIYDLALTKTVVGAGPFNPGGRVMFTITVFNQGTNTAFDVDVADYFDPAELSTPVLEGTPAGVADNADGTFTITSIPAGEQFAFVVSSTIDASFAGTEIINNAEITGGGLTQGGLDIADVDSSVGNNADDDPETANDNEIVDSDTGETIDDDVDEDDFDPASFMVEQVFDLALRKTLVSPTNGVPDGTVNFLIEVFNQGSVAATDLTITDYLPPGTQLADMDWMDNMDNTASYFIGNLAVGGTESVEITLSIDADVTQTSLTNYAEIASVNNLLDLDDQDSAPGDNQGVDESDFDNEIDDEFPGTPGSEDNPMDNDDYDFAVVPLCDIQPFAGTPQSICATGTVLLAGTISPGNTPGTWSSDGDGTFSEDEAGMVLTNVFGDAIYYLPGPSDIQGGTVTLTLTSGGACPAVMSTVEITVLAVDCGSLLWDGN